MAGVDLTRHQAPTPNSTSPPKASRQAVTGRLWSAPGLDALTPRRSDRRARRARVRPVGRAHPLPGALIDDGTIPPAAGRPARPGSARRLVLGQRRLRPGAHQGRPAPPARRRAGDPRDRDGRQPRRAGDAGRAPQRPRRVRRAVPAVGQLLPARPRRPGTGVRRVRADRPQRRRRARLGRHAAGRCRPCSPAAGSRRTWATTGPCSGRWSAQGYPASLHEVRDVHNYTAWRDALRPPPDPLIQVVTGARPTDPNRSDAMAETWHGDPQGGFAGHVRSYGHWGRPVLAFPAEAGSAGGLGEQRHGRRRCPTCSTPGGSSSTASIRRMPRPGRTGRSRTRNARAGTRCTNAGCSTRSCRSSPASAAAAPT